MMFTTTLMNFSLLVLSIIISFVNAFPIATRDVYSPPILTPTEGEVWVVGQNRTITWDTSNPPQQITNPMGRILLRKGDFTLNVTLAEKFSILLGAINITVPETAPGNDYRVVLFGDSGNWGHQFEITAEPEESSSGSNDA